MHQKQSTRFGALAVLLLVLGALPASDVLAQQSVLDQAVTATVRVLGCNLTGCNVGLGSGVIIHPSGVILTANHVTLTDARNPLSPHLEDFMIELTQNARSAPVARYRARLLATKPGSDLALLGIYWDEVAHRPLDDTASIGLPALPIADAERLRWVSSSISSATHLPGAQRSTTLKRLSVDSMEWRNVEGQRLSQRGIQRRSSPCGARRSV